MKKISHQRDVYQTPTNEVIGLNPLMVLCLSNTRTEEIDELDDLFQE